MYETEKEVKENPAQIKPTPKYKSEPHWTPYAQENKPLNPNSANGIDKAAKFQERQAKALQAQQATPEKPPEVKENYANNSEQSANANSTQ
jgi:hypothetical protein